MSFGGFGSQGTIRYALIVDDAQANAKIGTFKSSLTSLAPATQQVNSQMGALANNFKGVSGGLTSQNTLIGQSITQHQSLGTQIKTNISNFSNLAIGVSATATSALQLAAGFRDYNDAQIAVERVTRKLSLAQESLTKAQDKLQSLQTKGIKSGKDYAQAQLDVQQAQQAVDIQTQLLGESQERLFDSQSQFVVSIVPTVLGAVGTLGTAWKEFGGILKTTTGGVTSFGSTFSSVLGIGGPIALAAGAALLIISKVREGIANMQAAAERAKVSLTVTTKSFIESPQEATAQLARTGQEWDTLVQHMGGASTWQGVFGNWDEMIKKAKEGGAVFDKAGKLIITTQEHIFTLPAGFKDSSTQWITWMTNYRKAGESHEQILARLKTAKFDDATASKIAAAAEEDFANWKKVSAEATQQAIPTIEQFNERFRSGAKDIGLQSEALDDYLGGVNQTAIALAKYEQSTMGVTNANQVYYAWFLKLSPAQQQYVKLLEQGNKSAKDTIPTIEEFNARFRSGAKDVGLQSEAFDDFVINATDAGVSVEDFGKQNEDAAKKAKDAAKQIADAWQKTVDEFKQTKLDAASIFGFDKNFGADKVFKDMVKDLPSKLEKKLKGTIKANFKIEETEAGVKKFIESIIMPIKNMPGKYVFNPELYMDVDKAIKYGKDILNKIKDIPAADTQAAGKKLADAIGKGDWSGITQGIVDVMKTLNTDDMPPIPVKIVAIDLDASKFGGSSGGKVQGNLGENAGGVFNYINAKPKVSIPVQGVITQISSTYQTTNPQGETVTVTPGSEEEKLLKSKGGGGGFDVSQIQTVQKALQSLATYGIKNLQALAKAAKTNFDTVANYAAGATTSIQTDQKAIQSLVTYGTKNLASLGKASKTNFDTVANYSAGATGSVQTLQKAVDSMTKYGVKSMSSLAKSAKTNFDTVANYANGATKAVKALQSAINSLKDKTVTVTYKQSGSPPRGAQHGMHETLMGDTLIQAHKGERVDIGPPRTETGSGGMTGSNISGNVVINLTNVLADREITRTFRREIGKDFYRFGPS